MGMDQSLHIGPYIQGPKFKNISVPKTKYSCPKHPKTNAQSPSFCSSCGTKYEKVEYAEIEKMYMHQIVFENEEFEDDLFCGEGMNDILLPNDKPPSDINVDLEELYVIDLTEKNIEKLRTSQMAWMEKKYKKPLALLRKSFGEKEIVVKWGIVSAWN